MDKIRIAIHGSCVSRDTFDFDDSGRYEVCEYVARNTIFSSVQPPIDIGWFASRPLEKNWRDRMISINLEKTLFSRLKDSESDYLLIDLIDERFPQIRVPETYLTWTAGLKEFAPSLENTGQIVHGMTFPFEQTEEALRMYCQRIKSLFRSDRIILLCAKFVGEYLDKDGIRNPFPDSRIQYSERLNAHIRTMYHYLQKELRCQTIQLPPETAATEDHKWGLAPMHYETAAYLAFLKELKDIIQ